MHFQFSVDLWCREEDEAASLNTKLQCLSWIFALPFPQCGSVPLCFYSLDLFMNFWCYSFLLLLFLKWLTINNSKNWSPLILLITSIWTIVTIVVLGFDSNHYLCQQYHHWSMSFTSGSNTPVMLPVSHNQRRRKHWNKREITLKSFQQIINRGAPTPTPLSLRGFSAGSPASSHSPKTCKIRWIDDSERRPSDELATCPGCSPALRPINSWDRLQPPTRLCMDRDKRW